MHTSLVAMATAIIVMMILMNFRILYATFFVGHRHSTGLWYLRTGGSVYMRVFDIDVDAE